MKLKLKNLVIATGRPIVFMRREFAKELNLNIEDRVEVSFSGRKIIARIDLLKNYLNKDEVALSEDIRSYIDASSGDYINITPVSLPKSSPIISKKMNGEELSKSEIYSIIKDIVDNALSEVEIAQFVVAVYTQGMSPIETVHLTEAMYTTGSVLNWDSKIVADKHCIGGIAGNRTTPIVVSICAAAGIIMPKTSSRAITSAAGTADVIETLSRVDFPVSDLKKIVKKTNACLAWGGSLGLAPADDKLIRVERVLNIDPESQLLASILSKKLAAGSKYVLIDIPYGKGAKVSKSEAEKLKKKFLSLAKYFRLKLIVVLTDGSQPIGNGIGPVLEMIDVIKVLRRENPPKDLESKSLFLAGKILEMVGKSKKGTGEKLAKDILDSGKAFEKFEQIIDAQGRTNHILNPAKIEHKIKSDEKGRITHIDNKLINRLASILGCPNSKKSGVYLHSHKGDRIQKGDLLLTLYSDSDVKMKEGIYFFERHKPILFSKK